MLKTWKIDRFAVVIVLVVVVVVGDCGLDLRFERQLKSSGGGRVDEKCEGRC